MSKIATIETIIADLDGRPTSYRQLSQALQTHRQYVKTCVDELIRKGRIVKVATTQAGTVYRVTQAVA